MKNPLIVRPEAEEELAEAYEWYEQQAQGLGFDFLLHVEAALSSIQRSPQMYPVIYKNVHRCLVRRFPYGIFYLVERERIVILAIFHASRDPRAWQDRV